MLTLIKNASLYAPESLGQKDILIGASKIIKIDHQINIKGLDVDIIDAQGLIAVPGFIDNHVHVLGGGGEAGPISRVEEIKAKAIYNHGITTIIGLLGTDGFSRNMHNLISKIKGLKAAGLNAYALSGSYQVPVKTMLSSIEEDLLYIDEIIGVGEIAIADHRSSSPSIEELKKIISSAHVGGLLSNKAGVVNVHVGGAKEGLTPLTMVLDQTPLSAKNILPTHLNRSKDLLNQGIDYAKKYQASIDFTAYLEKNKDLSAANAYHQALKQGVDESLMTISSDAQGSLPKFYDDGSFKSMEVANTTVLMKDFKTLINENNMPITQALLPFTKNVANVYKLAKKGEIKVSYDADILLLDKKLDLKKTIINGIIMPK